MKEQSKQTTNKFIHAFDLPEDLFLGSANISLSGNSEIYISNHRGILSYEENTICILLKDYQLQIKGKELYISSYTRDDLTIKGYIRSLEFL